MGDFIHTLKDVFHGAGSVIKESIRTLLRDPHIMIYPYMAALLILVTSPLVSSFVISHWNKVDTPVVISEVSGAGGSNWLTHLGLVSFSVYYTLFVTAFFICAVSSATIMSLQEHKNIGWFDGLKVIWHGFFRITKFALLAIFFFPIGVIAQYKKFKTLRGGAEAIISSFSLGMVQLAPAIVKGHSGVIKTIRHSLDTLGHFWEESVVIRIATFCAALLLGSISFLPTLIQRYWFDDSTGQAIAWVLTGVLGVSSYVVLRVTSTVFMTNLYLRAERERKNHL